jgi:Transmembrane adaptor Erv26
LLQTLFSISCHVLYLQNLSPTWPLIELSSPTFIASCLGVVADHFLWFFYFARVSNEARRLRTYRVVVKEPPGFTEIAAFFGLCVWLVPLFLFLSLSANDHAIPMSAGESTNPLLTIHRTDAGTMVASLEARLALGWILRSAAAKTITGVARAIHVCIHLL